MDEFSYIIFHTILKIGVDDSINYLFAAHAEEFQIGLIDFIDVNRACAASALVAQLMLDLPSGSKRQTTIVQKHRHIVVQ